MAFVKIGGSSISLGGIEYKADASGVAEIPNDQAGEAAAHGEIVDAPESTAKAGKGVRQARA